MAHRRTINVRPAERLTRVVLGPLMVTGGWLLMPHVTMASTGIIAVLLIAVGMWLVVTGLTGHCPLYAQIRSTAETHTAANERAKPQADPRPRSG